MYFSASVAYKCTYYYYYFQGLSRMCTSILQPLLALAQISRMQYRRNFLLYTTENALLNDNVSMSVGHLDHVLIVYSLMEHVTWKSPGPMCG